MYLRFVVDHYDDLPELTVFVQARARTPSSARPKTHAPLPRARAQADAEDAVRDFVSRVSALSAGTLTAARVGYLPLNDGFVRNRTPALWRSAQFARRHPRVLDPDALSRDVRACWEKVAGWFGHADAFDGAAAEPAVSFYCCNYFAVARANCALRHSAGVRLRTKPSLSGR